jgi:hypothetical protein
MAAVKRLCVFCGASGDVDPAYRDAATRLGRLIAEAGIELVYGGGHIGLMGLLADAALKAGGKVTGVITDYLNQREIGHAGLSELVVVETMHERKQCMSELADAFAILPGGFGTLDETLEILTWRQLGLHDRPLLIVNIAGYWDTLLALFEQVIAQNFAGASARDLYRVVAGVEAVLPALAAAPAPTLPKSVLP